MKLPKIKPYLKKAKVYSNGFSPIYISLIKDRKQSLVSLGYSIPTNAWNEKAARVYESRPKINPIVEASSTAGQVALLKEQYAKAIVLPNAKTINQEIENKIAELTLLQTKLRANDQSLDVKSIKKTYDTDPNQDRTKSFLAYWASLADKELKAGNIGTYKRYKTTFAKAKQYMNGRVLTFQDITVQFLTDYEAHLKNLGLKVNSVHNSFKTMRAAYYKAIKENIIPQDKNPFFTFKLKTEKSQKDKLTAGEIKAIQDLILDEGSLIWNVRNYFIFSFNVAGMRVGDLIQLKWENIKKDRLEYTMDKTGSFKSILLSPKAKSILACYTGGETKPTNFIFPLLSNEYSYDDPVVLHNHISAKTALINKYLKKIAELVEIEKNVSFHIARHSFADLARKKKASIYDIRDLLGHSSVKITEGYLATLDYETQDEAMRDILDL